MLQDLAFNYALLIMGGWLQKSEPRWTKTNSGCRLSVVASQWRGNSWKRLERWREPRHLVHIRLSRRRPTESKNLWVKCTMEEGAATPFTTHKMSISIKHRIRSTRLEEHRYSIPNHRRNKPLWSTTSLQKQKTGDLVTSVPGPSSIRKTLWHAVILKQARITHTIPILITLANIQ